MQALLVLLVLLCSSQPHVHLNPMFIPRDFIDRILASISAHTGNFECHYIIMAVLSAYPQVQIGPKDAVAVPDYVIMVLPCSLPAASDIKRHDRIVT